MKKISLIITGLITLTNCATNSGVQQLAPNTYTLSVGVAGMGSISGNDTKAKHDSLQQANEFCSSKNKQILVQNTKMNSTYSGSTSELIFQCLTDKEAEAQPVTKYSKEPNLIIENRNSK